MKWPLTLWRWKTQLGRGKRPGEEKEEEVRWGRQTGRRKKEVPLSLSVRIDIERQNGADFVRFYSFFFIIIIYSLLFRAPNTYKVVT